MAYIEDNGVKLWYEITGKGEPLVLTGGFGCLHNQWDWIMDILNEDFQVINWNYRGSGQSDRYWGGGYSLDRWVDDLELILDSLNLNSVNLWGTSTGSPLTIRYTAKYQDRVKSMTTYPMFKADAAFRKAFLTFQDIGESFGYEALATFTSWIGVGSNHQNTDFGNKLAIHEAGLFKANFDMEALAKTLDTFMHFQLRSELGKISVPTLLLLGSSGMLGAEMPSVAQLMDEFRQYCPHTKVVTIPDAGGTYCMYEQPEKTAKALKEFINQLP
jgi:pimeloyl-ACP methyl ester carboxylesterase